MANEFEGAVPKAYVMALTSAFSCLTSELSKKGLIDVYDLAANIQGTAASHRAKGNPEMADHLHNISEYVLTTTRDAPPTKDPPSSGGPPRG